MSTSLLFARDMCLLLRSPISYMSWVEPGTFGYAGLLVLTANGFQWPPTLSFEHRLDEGDLTEGRGKLWTWKGPTLLWRSNFYDAQIGQSRGIQASKKHITASSGARGSKDSAIGLRGIDLTDSDEVCKQPGVGISFVKAHVNVSRDGAELQFGLRPPVIGRRGASGSCTERQGRRG
ncbi:hypothetical protein EYF80_032254 [Liparis tanakae]|uniref:Uncharacterized protein n=1 Tax=Liparis tanakae TaxID=230148 RepID=A0A4Z2GWB2_9TELE|nr:hypothetical protein EYF80_032254 [Liparis tanakae]